MSNDYVMTAPTMMDRNASSYMLVSYTHNDGAEVDRLLKELYKEGCDFWYDKEMEVGKNWEQQFESHLHDPNCQGMVLFVSYSYLLSEACKKEMEKFLERWPAEGGKDLPALIYLFDYMRDTGKPDLWAALDAKSFNEQTMDNADVRTHTKDLLKVISQEHKNLCVMKETLHKARSFFESHGCISVAKISDYARTNRKLALDIEDTQRGEIKTHYKMSFGKIITERNESGVWVEMGPRFELTAVWTAFLHDGKLSILLKNKPMKTCGRISAKNKLRAMREANKDGERVKHVLYKNQAGTERKCLVLTKEEEDLISNIRFLYKSEREDAEVADDINWALSGDYELSYDGAAKCNKDFDPEANGYIFVMEESADGKKQLFYYADRFSTDVYENVWRDEIASVVPVIEIKTEE